MAARCRAAEGADLRGARAARPVRGANRRAHEARRGERLDGDWIDPFSSAFWFEGWKDRVRLREPRQRELLNVPRPTAAPTVWLLRTGWRRWGPLAFDELAERG
jgi:hypothetical protein